MKTLQYSIKINAPKEKVWDKMFDKETYKIWTETFSPGSYFEGSWDEGSKIKFLGPDGSGGMTSTIAVNKPYTFLSIKHLGIIKNGIEDFDSPEARSWGQSFENYTFNESKGVTELKVDIKVIDEFEEYMQGTWPKALGILKRICE